MKVKIPEGAQFQLRLKVFLEKLKKLKILKSAPSKTALK